MKLNKSAVQSAKRKDTYKQLRITLGKLGFEMLPVIGGILIALFIDQVQDDGRDRKLLQSTLQSLSDEFTQNTTELNRCFPRHERLIDTLHRYQGNERFNLYDVMVKGGGFPTPTLLTTNWQITINNNSLRFMNFQTVKLLSQIQFIHQELQKQEDVLFPVAYGSPMYERGREAVLYRRGVEDLIISYKSNEKRLLILYEQFNKLVTGKHYLR